MVTHFVAHLHPGSVVALQVSDIHHDVPLVHIHRRSGMPGSSGAYTHAQSASRQYHLLNLLTGIQHTFSGSQATWLTLVVVVVVVMLVVVLVVMVVVVMKYKNWQ